MLVGRLTVQILELLALIRFFPLLLLLAEVLVVGTHNRLLLDRAVLVVVLVVALHQIQAVELETHHLLALPRVQTGVALTIAHQVTGQAEAVAQVWQEVMEPLLLVVMVVTVLRRLLVEYLLLMPVGVAVVEIPQVLMDQAEQAEVERRVARRRMELLTRVVAEAEANGRVLIILLEQQAALVLSY